MGDLRKLTVEEVGKGLRMRRFSCRELVGSVVRGIEDLNGKLNAFLTVDGEVREEAEKIDKLIAEEGTGIFDKKPLLGVPVAVKDNFLTKGLRTTAASKVLGDYVPEYESTVTRRLKEAGAIILGKTNMDAWAHGSSTETSAYGVTKNPWDEGRLPGGSSGGSAAAAAADLCVVAIGSETAGSIRQPAAWCGVTGMKPSYGRVSRYGVVAMASSTDSPGPLAKTVKDAAGVLRVIAGEDGRDATTIRGGWGLGGGDLDGEKKFRVGLVKEYFLERAEVGVNEAVMTAVEELRKAGVEVREVSLLDPKYAIADYTIIQRAEVSSNLARYDGVRYGEGRSFLGKEAKRRIMLGTYVLSAGYHDKYYRKAQEVRTKILADFEQVFEEVDLLVAPTSPSVALPLGASRGEAMFGEMQDVLVEASSMAGLPGMSVPCGFVEGLPVGMQIVGRFGEEEAVLQLGYIYQQLTEWHEKKPKLL